MSGLPKRSHEMGGHSSTTKYPHEEAGAHPKLAQGAVSNEYHPPYDISQDARLGKISREVDRKSPLHSGYRMPSASNDSHMETHPVASGIRVEPRESKESKDHRSFDNRDQRTEAREAHSEPKRDAQSVKLDKDIRLEIRGDDGKDTKHERETHNEQKNEVKLDKEALVSSASGQVTWKEAKEYHRAKRISESPNVHVDPWHMSRGNPQAPPVISKEGQALEGREYTEVREAVGENKVDSKNEDRWKDKDKKRKDVKYRDWGDKERNDRRPNFQIGNISGDVKDSVREEKEPERSEREKKDLPKDREKPKDHTKRESWNGAEKESSQIEKDMVDGSVKVPKLENLALEHKKPKEYDAWKNLDREKRKVKDADIEGDKPEKRIRLGDKESDDGMPDGEGSIEREREAFNYGVQQRKRMLRTRGSPQVTNREPLFKAQAQENEGFVLSLYLFLSYLSNDSGKSEVSEVVYKENITATNRQVRGGQLWGTDIYTDDSDLVAVLMHTGYCRPTASPPPPAIQELRATIRVLAPQDSYTSMLRNNVRSRAWGAGIACSYRVERCCIVKKGGGTIDLEPCLSHTSAVEPTLAPVAVERTMTTRAAASLSVFRMHYGNKDLFVKLRYNTTSAMSPGMYSNPVILMFCLLDSSSQITL
ncbi:hypothetical protein LINPERPRIM_LOCUS39536 [Linum perenne]